MQEAHVPSGNKTTRQPEIISAFVIVKPYHKIPWNSDIMTNI